MNVTFEKISPDDPRSYYRSGAYRILVDGVDVATAYNRGAWTTGAWEATENGGHIAVRGLRTRSAAAAALLEEISRTAARLSTYPL